MPDEWMETEWVTLLQRSLVHPKNESLQAEIPQGCHNFLVVGHFHQEKTIVIATNDFYGKVLAEWIRGYVRSCDPCEHSKSLRHAKYVVLQPLEVPNAAWSSSSTDFITQLQESQGKSWIMVLGDRLTKIAYFIVLHEKVTAKDVGDMFLREV